MGRITHHQNSEKVLFGIDPENGSGITALVEFTDISQKGGSSCIDTGIKAKTASISYPRSIPANSEVA